MENSILVTVFTATYNRANTLKNVYDSLCAQTLKAFEWIIVDDGSTDDTKKLVEQFIADDIIEIRYFYQDNNGKHIAMNKALDEARGEYFVNLDSDDIMKPEALDTFVKAWESIKEDERNNYMSVKARCFDPDTNELIGKPFDCHSYTTTILDAKYKEKINYEMWSMVRTDVRRMYKNPDIRGGKNGGGLRFYPEGIWQDKASRKYKTLFINEAIRGYARNTSTSLMGYGAKYDRYKENIHLWTHIVNDNFDYFFYDVKSFIKALVGVSMDGFFLNRGFSEILNSVNTWYKKLMVFILSPVGFLFYLKKR
ncbi:MAG: glycosyltransferase family 2 protein [Ruminococcus sp.]|nr:glycosyltransferase family 2 protein [Ruminococcus sp.]